MSFLEFLRKFEASGATGAIAGWLHKRWAQSHPTEARRQPLAEFANAYEMQGNRSSRWSTCGASTTTTTTSRIGPCMDAFRIAAVEERVLVRYRWLATALVLTDNLVDVPGLHAWLLAAVARSHSARHAPGGAFRRFHRRCEHLCRRPGLGH